MTMIQILFSITAYASVLALVVLIAAIARWLYRDITGTHGGCF